MERNPHPKLQNSSFPIIIPLLMFTAGVAMRLWRLTYVTLWSDEFRGTLQLIQLSWRDLLMGNYGWDMNPPLYFLLLKGWVRVLGSSDEGTLRLFSIFLSLGSLIIVYFLGKKLGNWRAGVFLLAVLAFHPVYLFYSTDLRMYSLLILLSLMAFFFYAEYTFGEQHSKWWLLALSITLALAAYTHYFGVLVGFGVTLFSLSQWLAKKDRLQLPVFGAIGLGILLTLPLINILLRQYERYVERTSTQALVQPILSLQSLLAVLSGSASFDFRLADSVQMLSLFAVIAGVVFLFRNQYRSVAFVLVAYIALAWLLTYTISTQNIGVTPRYLIHIFIFPWIIAALTWIDTRDRISKLLRIFVVVALGANMYAGISQALARDYPTPNWKEVAQILEQEVHDTEPIVIMGWDATPVGYYSQKVMISSYELERQLVDDPAGSYMILDSEHSRRLNFIDYSNPIYENPTAQVRIIRYIPGGQGALPAP